MKMSISAFLIVIVFGVSALAQSRSGIEGVWALTEVTSTGPNGKTQQMSQPSMYLFTRKHYSIIYISSEGPRAVPDDISKLSSEELRNIFVDSFIANAGTYEMKNGKVTLRPMVAKSPGYMQPGIFVTSSFKISGNMMTLVTESTNGGPAANPTTYKLKRIE